MNTKINHSEPFEKTLFKAADKLRKNMDAAEYKHIVLGLIFLKYISDSFEELYAKINEGKGEFAGATQKMLMNTSRKCFFCASNLSLVYLHSRSKLPSIGKY